MSQRYIGGLIYNPPGGYSGYFDGSGDTLTSAASNENNFGTGDWTFELWVNSTVTTRADAFGWNYSFSSAGHGSLLLNVSASGSMGWYENTTARISATATGWNNGAWNHIAITRSGNSVRMFLNGTQVGSTYTTSFSYGANSSGFMIGAIPSGTGFTGYISNFRAVKGTALYTSNFTPPNGPLQAISGTSLLTCAYSTFRDGSSNAFTITVNGNTSVSTQNPFPITTLPNPALGNQGNGVYSMSQYVALKAQGLWPAYDPYFDQTTLLLHGDGTNGAQNNTFLDSSTNNFTITRNGNTTQGTFSPFSQDDGKWGAYFDGSGDYLTTSSSITTGTGNFTVEAWIWTTVSNQKPEIWQRSSLISDFVVSTNFNAADAGVILGETTTAGSGYTTLLVASTVLTANAWNHVAWVRSSGTITVYINGVASGTVSSAINSQSLGTIGAFSAATYDFSGYISNLRVTNTAVYTSAFTPSTTPLTAISGTSLLTCQSNRFVDNSANAFAITVNGNTSIQPFSPFAPSAAYSAAVNGGSGYFDGTGDYLRTNSASLGVSTQNFTAECWIYPTTSMDTNDCLMWLMNSDQTNSAGNTWALRAASSNNITAFVVYGSTLVSVSSTTPVNINQWNHVAICRSGTTLYLGVNGAIYSTSIGSVTLNNQQYLHIGGAVGNGTPQYFFTGYISGARYEINAALYTSAYTVPTAPTSPTGSTFCGEFTNAGILDNTGRNDLETVGNAQISTSVKKFGTGSLAFDGTGDYLLLRPSQQLIFEGDFTIEFWLYITLASSTYHSLIGNYNGNGTTNWQIEVQNTGVIRLYYNGSSSPIVSASGVITNETWQHIAAVRSGSTVALYVNGSQIGTASFSGALGNTTTNTLIASIPQTTTQEVVGYIDDLRITKGVARYTSNFTPQTSQWQDQ